MGYALPVRKLPNPIDIVLVYAQRVGTTTDNNAMCCVNAMLVFCCVSAMSCTVVVLMPC